MALAASVQYGPLGISAAARHIRSSLPNIATVRRGENFRAAAIHIKNFSVKNEEFVKN